MDVETLRREIERLSPWYYRHDLGAISTDITPPCDHHGHREAHLPEGLAPFLAGRTVLDVACNEGGYSFQAVERGAREVHGFDVRAINVEKGSFVAKVRGIDNVHFEASSCDEWIRSSDATFDYVFLCGLLYHLPEPWRTIREYAARAREGMWVTCVLNGGPEGYTPFPERETIAASEDPDEMSQMPNSTRTLVEEFAQHGFLPLYVHENRKTEFWGACALFLRNVKPFGDLEHRPAEGPAVEDFELFVVPRHARGEADTQGVDVVIYGRRDAGAAVDGHLRVTDAGGRVLSELGPEPLELPPRASKEQETVSASHVLGLELDLPGDGAVTIEARLTDRGGSETLISRRLVLA